MRARTITAKARVEGDGCIKRALVPSGILTLSLAVALMAATAGTASGHRGVPMSLGPAASVGFGDRQVGTTSPAQAFTLRVGCRPTVSGCEAGNRNPKIGVPGDYTQTNDCPPTLMSGQSCTINVAFAPLSTGSKTGTLRTGRRTCVKEANSRHGHDESCEAPTATLNGTGVISATAATPPLTLSAGNASHDLGASPKLYVVTNHDSTVVVSGRKIRKTRKATKPVCCEAYRAVIPVKPKHPSRFDRPGRLTAKIKVAATDEFGQTATVEIEERFHLWPHGRHRGRSLVSRDGTPAPRERVRVGASVKLKYRPNDPNDPYGAGGVFLGRVKASRGCQKGRMVVLYSGFPGGGNKLSRGSDRTNDRGKYKIKWRGGSGPVFFLKAKEKRIAKSDGDKVVCKARKSNKLGLI